MKCPYCGAEVLGRICEYCDSEIIRPDLPPQEQETPVKKEKKKVQVKESLTGQTVPELVKAFLAEVPDIADSFTTMMFDSTGNRKTVGKDINRKLFQNLSIGSDENIYLIHDDSLFRRGSNGFAITSSGFHCLEMLESPIFTSWDALLKTKEFAQQEYLIKADRNAIVYLTGVNESMPAVLKLCQALRDLYELRGDSAIV